MAYFLQTLTSTTDPDQPPTGHHFYQQDGGARRLMVLLPGRSYTAQRPLLHYTGQIGLQLGYDVLAMRYSFHEQGQSFDIAYMPEIRDTCENVINQALDMHDYDDLVLVGKSLGALMAVTLARTLHHPAAGLILQTPIRNSINMVSADLPTLAIIGTADTLYNPAETIDRDSLRWLVYEGLDHSLEAPGQWRTTVHALPEILRHCEAFLVDLAPIERIDEDPD